jgi:predicted metal-dependent hydrolase
MPTRELVSRDLRRLALGAGEVAYVLLRRRGRRGVGLKVDAEGLTVSAPVSVPVARIEDYLRECERWIVKKLAQWGARRLPPVSWADGAALPYLGGTLVLRTQLAPRAHVELADGELRVATREAGDEAVKRAVVGWYRRTALALLAGRAFTFARIGGLPMPRVFLSSAATRWGSCNSRREIRLAWRLLKAPPAIIDYVVCHELAHLRHMNHSPAFWAEVERLCPDHRRLRRELVAADHLYRSF